jgi:hypothetical protein
LFTRANWRKGSNLSFAVADTTEARRRIALAEIFERVALVMVNRVVVEAVRASNFLGMGSGIAERYGNSIKTILPAALETLKETVAAERDRKMRVLVARVRSISNDHRIPRIIERGLVGIAFDSVRRLVREDAEWSGFSADELDAEFVAFRNEFESTLFESQEALAGVPPERSPRGSPQAD